MPIDLEKIVTLEREEKEERLHPKHTKRTQKHGQNLTHWVILDIYGKQHGGWFKSKADYEMYLWSHYADIGKDGPPRVQKLVCHPSITCNCGEVSTFLNYTGHDIVYVCKNKHKTKLNEYD